MIEYRNVPHFSFGGAVTFQVVFFEGSPNIRFNYADVAFGSSALDNGASQTVGVQVLAGVARQYSFNTPSLEDGMSLLWAMGAPIAAAGPDRVVAPGAEVELDGSQSTGAAGYHWQQTAGTPVVLSDASAASPTFVAPDPPGPFDVVTFQLTVTGTCGAASTASVSIVVVGT